MATSQKPVKITFNVWTPLKEQLDSKTDAACLRRDAYLAKVLEGELEFLDQEVSIPNSEAAFDYVQREFSKLQRESMSLALPPLLAQRLKDICNRKRIYRDAFLNRLLLLLVAAPKTIDALLFHEYEGDWRTDLWKHHQREGSVDTRGFVPLVTTFDPFWAFREALALFFKDETTYDWMEPSSGQSVRVRREFVDSALEPLVSLYTLVFTQKAGGNSLLGLSCYLPDRRIPGSSAASEHQAKLDEMFFTL